MRKLWMIAVASLVFAGSGSGSASAQDPLATTDILLRGILAPRQLADGTKTWVFTRGVRKPDGAAVLADLIAQGLANAHWCNNGWEQTSNSVVSGTLVIEGRCK
jgi:hypothetical protein